MRLRRAARATLPDGVASQGGEPLLFSASVGVGQSGGGESWTDFEPDGEVDVFAGDVEEQSGIVGAVVIDLDAGLKEGRQQCLCLLGGDRSMAGGRLPQGLRQCFPRRGRQAGGVGGSAIPRELVTRRDIGADGSIRPGGGREQARRVREDGVDPGERALLGGRLGGAGRLIGGITCE